MANQKRELSLSRVSRLGQARCCGGELSPGRSASRVAVRRPYLTRALTCSCNARARRLTRGQINSWQIAEE